ncbi:MAG: S8 family serine peptidase [Actinobacteria bacterium]|nr:S8 family serine peptidase [Actinomycetota bacterium]
MAMGVIAAMLRFIGDRLGASRAAGFQRRALTENPARRWPLLAALSALLLALAASLVAAPAPAAASTPGGEGVRVEGEVILRPRTGKLAEAAREALSRGLRFVRGLPGGMLLMRAPRETDLTVLEALPSIDWAEPDLPFRAAESPNDPDYPLQWNLQKIKMPGAWDIAAGGDPSVVVAVVDSGVAYRDSGTFRRAPDFAATSFVPGYDFVANDAYPDDEYGHGTHVAAIIASAYNNAFRAAGMAYSCSIMPVRVLGAAGSGTASAVASGIYYAADNGASVINLSVASPRHSKAVSEAVRYAWERGVLCVAASGNEGSDPGYPGGMDCPADEGQYVIAVGATDCRDLRAHYSNYGEGLDLVAPGGDLTRDDNGDGHGDGIPQEAYRIAGNHQSGFALVWGEGTSMASAQVSAAAALLLSLDPKLTPGEVTHLLTSSASDLGEPGWDEYYGHGLLDVEAALASLGVNTWYFAEGTTREGFEEWLCVLNAGEEVAPVEFTFLMPGGETRSVTYDIPAASRFSLNVNSQVDPEKDVAATASSPQPIVAERAMYYSYKGSMEGGSATLGARHPGTTWYFAEGTTRAGFEEWLTLANPGDEDALVTVEYMLGAGQGDNVVEEWLVPARSRVTVNVNLAVGPDKDVSMRVVSDRAVVAERPMYFSFRGAIPGGHNVMGAPSPGTTWYFAEGTTRAGFEEWLTLANPGDEDALVTVEYMLGAGQGDNVVEEWLVPARSRVTVNVNLAVGPDKDVSMRVVSDRAVVAERPMYFSFGPKGWKGGSCGMGYDPVEGGGAR